MDDEKKINQVKLNMMKLDEGFSLNSLKGKDAYPYTITTQESYTVNKVTVTDYKNDDVISRLGDDEPGENEELDLIILEDKMENGKAYNVQYKVISNPIDKNKLVGIVMKSPEDAVSDVENFVITEEVKASLIKFKQSSVDDLFKRFKGFAGNFIVKNLFLATDLTFHSVLRFRYHDKIVRGVIYASIIGESRTGKSEAVQNAIRQYRMGKITNAKLATLVALIGGSTNKDGG